MLHITIYYLYEHHFSSKGLHSQSYGFSSSHVQMWKLDHKEGWVQKNWCLQAVVLEKTLESCLDSKKIKPVNPKGNQLWIFIGKTDAEAPVLWLPDEKCQLIGKNPDLGEDWSQNREGGSRGWNGWIASRLNENEFEQTPGDSGGQRILVCCSPWDGPPAWLSTLASPHLVWWCQQICQYNTVRPDVLWDLEENGRKWVKPICHHPIQLLDLFFRWPHPGIKDLWKVQFFLTQRKDVWIDTEVEKLECFCLKLSSDWFPCPGIPWKVFTYFRKISLESLHVLHFKDCLI